MKKQFLRGFLFTAAVGTLLHFLYEWAPTPLTALFGAVNESVWEHMKLLFVPVFFWLLFVSENRSAGAAALAVGLGIIASVYYTYTGALGYRVIAVDIALFYAAAAVVFALHRRWNGRWQKRWQQAAAWVGLTVMALSFIVWTFYPPRYPLWQDPSGGYGIIGEARMG